MNEDKAKSILDGAIKENNLLHRYVDYIYWDVSNEKITLDGEFTADELEALAWWIKHKNDFLSTKIDNPGAENDH